MAPKLEDLDSKFWKELKKNAGIKKSGWFKKADAGIGGLIEKVNKTRDAFRNSDMVEDLFKYQKALDALAEGFSKFIEKKNLDDISEDDVKKEEKEELVADLKEWSKEIDRAKKDLDGKILKLHKAVDGDFKKIEQSEKKKRREVWNKMGLDI